MAEGHLVARWAKRLDALAGEPFAAVELPTQYADRCPHLTGQHLVRTASHGKHLLLHLSTGETLHCHAMMFGSWQFGKPGMALRKPAERVRLRLRTRSHEAVFFSGPVVELLTPEQLATHPRLSLLGPDILAEDFDRDEAWRLLTRFPDRQIGEAVLDQTVVAGIGNIYKSEALFLARIEPRSAVGGLPRAVLDRLWRTVIPLMRQGVSQGRMRTRLMSREGRDDRFWVYQRRGKPCFRCGSTIERIKQGNPPRSSYLCPQCQGPPACANSEPPRVAPAKQKHLPLG